MWDKKAKIGFIEIETDYARLLRNKDGKVWSSLIVTQDSVDIWSALSKAIPEFFPEKTELNFICSIDGGSLVFEFPNNLTDQEILGNLQANRKTFFNETEELHFSIKKGSINPTNQKREITVSYIKQSTLDNIKLLCQTIDYKLGKITTLPDSLLGSIHRQYKNIGKEVNICIQIGFSRVNILIFRGNNLISVRTLLTGCLRELESELFTEYSLVREEIRLLISGKHPQPVEVVMNSIRENRLELLTHLGGVFAELRIKKMLDANSQVFLSYDIIDEPMLTGLIADRFDIKVNIITGIEQDENCEKYEDYPVCWLCGSSSNNAVNLIPPKKITFDSLFINPKVVIISSILITILPLPTIYFQRENLIKEVNFLREKQKNVQNIIDDVNSLKTSFAQIESSTKVIQDELSNRGISTRITKHLTENLPEHTRLESLGIDFKTKKLNIVGYTVDAESTLRYLDSIKTCKELNDADIAISDLETRRIKFVITANINYLKNMK